MNRPSPAELTALVIDFVKSMGAARAGVAALETLAGGPPSADITYLLPEARSAVSFCLPLDQSLFDDYLSKKDRLAHEKNNIEVNSRSSGIALDLARFLEQRGIAAAPAAVNNVYRPEAEGGLFSMLPDVSHRYAAAASGVGRLGLSGNLLTPEHGAAVILGTVVMAAEAEPTPPLEEIYCDCCRICQAACASALADPEVMETVMLGGMEHTYARRRNYMRCEFVCGGFTGLHSSGEWSNWSPGRFRIPESDEEFKTALIKGLKATARRPEMEGGFPHVLMRTKLYLTCGNCQLLCAPDRAERTRRYKLLTESGVVVQNEDGSLEAVRPEEAAARLEEMPPERRALYQD